MKLKINFKQTRATSAGDINSPNLLGKLCFVAVRRQANYPIPRYSPDYHLSQRVNYTIGSGRRKYTYFKHFMI